MKLSDELFNQITRSFGAARLSDDGEARNDARMGLVGRAVIIACPARCGRRPASVAVRDLSATGLGIIHSQRLNPGEQFVLRVPPISGELPPTAVLCAVIHCQPLALGVYAIGARFAQRVASAATHAPSELPAGDAPTMQVDSLAEAFRDQAAGSLTPEEHEQLRQVEDRLSRLQTQ